MDFSLNDARELVSNELLWPKVRDYLAAGGTFAHFPKGVQSRLPLVDAQTRKQIELWCEALVHAEEWKSVVDGATVRELKAKYPGIYPDVFRYTVYFSKFKPLNPTDEAVLMLLLKLKFPEVYALCSS